MNFVTHLECANCGQRYEAGKIHNLCTACNRPLWVKYDLDALKKKFKKRDLMGRPITVMLRYRELLPIISTNKIVSLSESITPILQCDRLAAEFDVKTLLVKDESRLPPAVSKLAE